MLFGLAHCLERYFEWKAGVEKNVDFLEEISSGMTYKPRLSSMRRTLQGIITFTCNDYVIVNNSAYFAVQPGISESLKVGDKINAVVQYDEFNDNYILSSISSSGVSSSEVESTSIEVVQSVDGVKVNLQNGDSFKMDIVVNVDGDLIPGDWVRVKRLAAPYSQPAVVEPLRTFVLIGTVKKIQRDNSLILDDNILIPNFVRTTLEGVAHGVKIKARCIENSGRQWSWRATYAKLYADWPDEVHTDDIITLDSLCSAVNSNNPTDVTITPASIQFDPIAFGKKDSAIITILSTNNNELVSVSLKGSENVTLAYNGTDIDKCLPLQLRPNRMLNISVVLSPVVVGKSDTMVKFRFSSGEIVCLVKTCVFDEEELKMANDSTYSKRPRSNIPQLVEGAWVIPGQRPILSTTTPARLPKFAIPENFASNPDVTINHPELLLPLTPAIYKKKFHSLLYLEELCEQKEMKQFDLENVVLYPYKDFLILEVPNLSEGRPSLLLGDRVLLADSTDICQRMPFNEGFIHEISKNTIRMKFCEDFHQSYQGDPCNVTFSFNRGSIRKAHVSVDYFDKFPHFMLFPQWYEAKSPLIDLSTSSNITTEKPRPRFGYGIEVDVPFCLPIYSFYDPIPKKSAEYKAQKKTKKKLRLNSIGSTTSSTSQNQSEKSYRKKRSSKLGIEFPTTPSSNKSFTESGDETSFGESFQMNNLSPADKLKILLKVDSPKKLPLTVEKDSHTIEDYHKIHFHLRDVKNAHLKCKSVGDVYFNRNLNDRQKAAVHRILKGEARPIPYILFGPPGTGKTITLVESLLQVFHRIPSSRSLACTPSNSASDLIIERLHDSGVVSSDDVVRYNALQRPLDAISDIVGVYSKNENAGLEAISRHKIVVCTCTTAGSFFQLQLKSSHFTHIFIDEAGQATEPEAIIPLVLGAGNREAVVVLAGDPMQLGPVLRSSEAIDMGLSQSLLERLSLRQLYHRDQSLFADDGNYNPQVITKLICNYRSHSSLLALPSKLFYHDELIPCADRSVVCMFQQWEYLPNPDLPIIFHGIRGQDMREGESPSWFNPAEAVQIVRYCSLLLKSNDAFHIEPEDIGIIAPYRKQVEKIRQLLDSLEIYGIKVGSVEEFQGQERLVILISTVRSDESKISSDVFHNLGFLSNPKRFNVAITRAQSLLIVAGNPFILSKDSYWKTFIRYAIDNSVYTGCELPIFSDSLPKADTSNIDEKKTL